MVKDSFVAKVTFNGEHEAFCLSVITLSNTGLNFS